MRFKGPSKLESALIKRGICTHCRQHKDKHVRATPSSGLRCPGMTGPTDFFTIPMGSVRL